MITVRIIMPAYNAGCFIEAAIKSVLAQTFEDWELFVVDDGSIDDTGAIVRAFTNDRIVYIRQKNAGPEVARQRGFRGCDAEFVARMDADDVMVPTRLEEQVGYLRSHPDVSVVGGQIEFMSEDGSKLAFRSCWPLEHDEIMHRIFKMKCGICNATTMCKREAQEHVHTTRHGGPGADIGFLVQMGVRGRLANLSSVVHYIRIHKDSIQSSADQFDRIRRARYSIACAKALSEKKPITSWESFVAMYSRRSFWERICEKRDILCLKAWRKAQWHYLNGPLIPQYPVFLALSMLLVSPEPVVRRLRYKWWKLLRSMVVRILKKQ